MWPIVQLGELCENILSGGTPSTESPEFWNSEIPWLSSADILDHKHYIIRKGVSKLWKPNILPKNNILVVTRVGLGKAIINNEDVCFSQDLQGLVLKSSIVDRRYLLYALLNKLTIFKQISRGATIKGVTRNDLISLQIPLPPLPIQQQIADTLNKADALRRKDQELLDKYDELAQAVFYEMFGDISINSKNWNIVQIRSIAQEVKYGTSSPAAASGSYPYLRMNNISYSGELLLDDLKYISASEKEFEKYGTRYGDLLFNRTNSKDLVGKTTIVDTETLMIIAGYLIRVRFNDQANPWYVSTFMNSTHMKKVLRNKCKSIIGMANINAQELQDFDIPLPPKELQDSFAEKLTHIKKQQSIIKKTQSKSSAYFNQCLYNYFV